VSEYDQKKIEIKIIQGGSAVKFVIPSIILFFISSMTSAMPKIDHVTINSDTIGLYDKFEIALDFSASFTNPYDFEQVNLQAVFISPSDKNFTVDGFYYQDFKVNNSNGTLIPSGSPNWRIRFAPTEAGTWSYVISIRDAAGTTVFPAQTFTCFSSGNHGFIRKANDRYLKFDDGKPYFAIGENIGWYGSKTIFDYQDWMTKLAINGGNYMRVWMCSWAFAIEWKDTGLGNYDKRQGRAFQLDWVLDLSRQKEIYVQLCLNNHGQVSTTANPEWNDNPYNKANGGPCDNTGQFFTNTAAKKYYQNRMRYIIARWGYSPNILAWELFNEVDLTDDYDNRRTEVALWHDEMAKFINSFDGYHHLITTSYAYDRYEPATWNNPIIDYTQIHNYTSSPDIESIHSTIVQSYLRSHVKPVLVGEFSLNADPSNLKTVDPAGIYFHNALWASLVSGSFGTAMTWWWDNYIHPQNLYYHFKPIAEFIKTIDLLSQSFKPVVPICQSNTRVDLTISPGFSSWAKSPENQFTINSDGTTSPGIDKLGRYLFGASWNTQHRNPPTLLVDYPQPGQFKVVTSGSTGSSPRIEIWLDNVKILSQPAQINKTYSIDVPAGQHRIFVDNQGADWIEISGYVIASYIAAIRSYALVGENQIIGWVQHRSYNWQSVKEVGVPAPVNDGKIQFSNLAHDGKYQIEWRLCSSGSIFSTDTVNTANGSMTLAVPPIYWDYAYKISLAATKAETKSHLMPEQFKLEQNFPNPFNSDTVIQYSIPRPGEVDLAIFNLEGKLVQNFTRIEKTPGSYSIVWDGTNNAGSSLASGIYFYQLKVDNGLVDTKRMVLMK
jgi:hypothetical protein